MKLKSILLIMLTVFIMTCSIALGESDTTDSIVYGEWDWDNESVNTFIGTVDISQWNDLELTFRMEAVFEPQSSSASDIVPKFSHFNGKRLPMLRQSDAITYKPEKDQKAVEFEGTLQMPEKDHFQKITIDLTLTNPDGRELKKIRATVSTGEDSVIQRSNIFYIPFEIRTVAIITGAAALLVWILTIIRNRILNRNK